MVSRINSGYIKSDFFAKFAINRLKKLRFKTVNPDSLGLRFEMKSFFIIINSLQSH